MNSDSAVTQCARILTPSEEDEILREIDLRNSLEDKVLMEKWGVSRQTLYRARWRAEQRRRERADSERADMADAENKSLLQNVSGLA